MAMLPGLLLSEAISELSDIVIDVAKTTANFKPDLDLLRDTLRIIAPIVQDIVNTNRRLVRTEAECKMFTDEILEAKNLVDKCKKVKRNPIKKFTYSLKLKDVNAKLLNFFQIEVQAIQILDNSQVLLGVNDLNFKMDGLSDIGVKTFQSREIKQRVLGLNDMKDLLLRNSSIHNQNGSMSTSWRSDQSEIGFVERDEYGRLDPALDEPLAKLKAEFVADTDNRQRLEPTAKLVEIMCQTNQPNDLKIPLQDIKDCTEDFNERNFIGKGGYGNVYKGILTWGDHVDQLVAVKRLDVTGFQGSKEFYTELSMLSQYQHNNIITLIGFCDDNKEMILVYEYASHGSLDRYLRAPAVSVGLPWPLLLQICIDVASALDYLHNHVAEKHRIIHRDIKSANVLLDENWNAKLADFGLSRIGLANQQNTFVVTNLAGTHGYCDPQYERTGILTKESDVYSFGVVCLKFYVEGQRVFMIFTTSGDSSIVSPQPVTKMES